MIILTRLLSTPLLSGMALGVIGSIASGWPFRVGGDAKRGQAPAADREDGFDGLAAEAADLEDPHPEP